MEAIQHRDDLGIATRVDPVAHDVEPGEHASCDGVDIVFAGLHVRVESAQALFAVFRNDEERTPPDGEVGVEARNAAGAHPAHCRCGRRRCRARAGQALPQAWTGWLRRRGRWRVARHGSIALRIVDRVIQLHRAQSPGVGPMRDQAQPRRAIDVVAEIVERAASHHEGNESFADERYVDGVVADVVTHGGRPRKIRAA